ncbi:MAG: enoyl-CoA hydratase [Myxococcota bacterium]|nr:enoyl-CoA hydratase [Myxococcota bacterium]
MPPLKLDDSFQITRVFNREEVSAFCDLTGDFGAHHNREQSDGKVVVPGLLTGSLPTQVGGKLNFLISELQYVFNKPVRTGETVTCKLVIDNVTPHPKGSWIHASIEIRSLNQVVVKGSCAGLATDSNQ